MNNLNPNNQQKRIQIKSE